MFGKRKKSSNDRFVMAAGRKAGNLSLPKGKQPVRGDSDSKSVATFNRKKPSKGKQGTL